MCGNNICLSIVCRVLHWCERIYFFTVRQYNNTTRMLPCGSSYPDTALHNTVNLTDTLALPTFFIIVFHITKCRFICQCTNSSCLKSMSRSENNFRISMGISLIFTREVQVNIWLFISFESQESLKRNIKSFFSEGRPAYRAFFIRHVTARPSGKGFDLFRIKIIIMADFTVIMWT